MDSWKDNLRADPTDWLLEADHPGSRYLAMQEVFGQGSEDAELRKARELAHKEGPIAALLDAMEPDGYWAKSGPGYNPKYRSSVWSFITLSQLGAKQSSDARLHLSARYLLDNALAQGGRFSTTGAPSGTADCLQGNLLNAMFLVGIEDDRLQEAVEWMARTVNGEGLAPNTERDAPLRYYAGKCGPRFQCGANNKLSCAWGAVKVLMAFAHAPVEMRTGLVQRAIETGVDFLLSVDPAGAEYPTGYSDKPSRNWWKFGFPVFYITDLLQLVETLVLLGYAGDERLQNATERILEKQDDRGRWPLEYTYSGKMLLDFGGKNKPSKWVTIRALRVLKEIL